ncbi:MAG: HAMP domain-containing histidine kinase [Proteobacteria bacterium]|nr:HAMP domain-containing histidine kinase [Pseudomonadota bacterium]
MRPGHVAIFLTIVIAPLAIAAWLGLKVTRDEQKIGQHQFQTLLEGRLRDVDSTIANSVQQAERYLLERVITASVVNTESFGPADVETLRRLRRNQPLVREFFALDRNGVLVFPPADDRGDSGQVGRPGDASVEESAFRERTAPIWRGQAVLYEPPSPERPDVSAQNARRSSRRGERPGTAHKSPGTLVGEAPIRGDTVLALAATREHGWITWYWEEGLHLLLWRRARAGGVIGVEIERVVLLSRIVSELPESRLGDGRVVLADSRGDPIHQWGPYEPSSSERPLATTSVHYPLQAWRLNHYASPAQRQAVFGKTLRVNLITGLAAIAFGLIAMAFLFYRDYARKMRDAQQRVNFVTQVSHELKTPLTNIRLYAELLQNDLVGDDHESAEKSHHRAEVIVAESQRLTRLINNILTFSKQRRKTLELSKSWIDLDHIVTNVVDQFAPALAAKGIEYSITTRSKAEVFADSDAVGQIVANLVSNVEKYAADGGVVEVTTEIAGQGVLVRVTDRGPGIDPDHRDRIFRPFHRVSNKLTDGVTGTGLGLAIARDLARQNGADLRLAPAETSHSAADIEADSNRPVGACFELVFDRRRETAIKSISPGPSPVGAKPLSGKES